MQNQYVAEYDKPTAAYYLTLIGGILGIVAGVFLLIFLIGIWVIIANVMIIVYAKKLMEEPMEHSKWANYIIIFSVLSGLNLLALIGGILASVYNPPSRGVSPQFALPKTQQLQTRICAQCGTITVEDAYFCPSCGKRLS
ncbi:MAG: zinc ribbon domain-containing protein [Candidatus Bathyarchaeota archaeon]|nr:zinc ribbon domain-containing protein [Candidatus Bathyarchaeota archaeon]MDD4325272.1 zinc ribbon domain-containing protein [Candidatus Bathyarchaeota archaeon]MDI9578413.1 zinc ribbon domain-containing protein [Thermoproteota archaeon]MDT8783029.1 zinc ribbon domain-containing protein [Candidatus Bathyarchaeota archaeon]